MTHFSITIISGVCMTHMTTFEIRNILKERTFQGAFQTNFWANLNAMATRDGEGGGGMNFDEEKQGLKSINYNLKFP